MRNWTEEGLAKKDIPPVELMLTSKTFCVYSASALGG
jgi:hypothetical protein